MFAYARCFIFSVVLSSAAAASAAPPPQGEAGLLFYVSGSSGLNADIARAGTEEPTFASNVSLISDGALGPALRCDNLQRLAWKAPGNIYAQRGTLTFYWRSRYPVGPTEFPIFRVGYGDHSSWDMVWLRIDYNGKGFDAFVTDTSLARIRVATSLSKFPTPETWTHFAFTWDETEGVRLFINGRLAAENLTAANLDSALDQFGPHSRVISPYQVQSDYNFTRGGDIDELRIYDRALSPGEIAAVQIDAGPATSGVILTAPNTDAQRNAFNHRYGFLKDVPKLNGPHASVRKVQIQSAYDLKRWWWKANDGIRETTWPGVYNRSRLPGRNDYFQLPDWDCYSLSGKNITFELPDEEWNHLEISGAADGSFAYLTPGEAAPESALQPFFERSAGLEKSAHRFTQMRKGGRIRFTNREQETPISEFSAYRVGDLPAPAAEKTLRFTFTMKEKAKAGTVTPIEEFIAGRHPLGERTIFIATSDAAAATAPKTTRLAPDASPPLPVVHFVVPWEILASRLGDQVDRLAIDGIVLQLPPGAPTKENIKWNVQVKDPLWPMRNDLDYTFSGAAGRPKSLWLDLRNRLLTPHKAFYLTVACDQNMSLDELAGITVQVVFAPRENALVEHAADRFTQLKDSYAMLVEEHPRSEKFNLWNRFKGDLDDLLRVEPTHQRGLEYRAAALGTLSPLLKLHPSSPTRPAIPLWAHRQVELLKAVERFVMFYIDRRQIENGELGGGLSDDTDLLNYWPGTALMGVQPDKVAESVHRLLEACYAQGMFTKGLSSIQTDELHSYEEGINTLGQALLLEYGSPRQLERAMETALATEGITGINRSGHRHIRSSYFSGSRIALESPWNQSKAYSYLILHPTQLLSEYNGMPRVAKFLEEMADGLVAHRVRDGRGGYTLNTTVIFDTDEATPSVRGYLPSPLLWTVWKQKKDEKYLQPIHDAGPSALLELTGNALDQLNLRETWRNVILETAQKALSADRSSVSNRAGSNSHEHTALHLAWQLTGEKAYLESLYDLQIAEALRLEYINTEGSLWTDRVGLPVAELQRARLGGIALLRNKIAPGHLVSWKFQSPARGDSVAILIKDPTPTSFRIIAHNLEPYPVVAAMSGGEIEPGRWEMTQGIDRDSDDAAEQPGEAQEGVFERGMPINLSFPPNSTSVIEMKLKTKGVPYSQRPDIGIDRYDLVMSKTGLDVRIHSLGAVPSGAFSVSVVDLSGKTIASQTVAGMEAPTDLRPRTVTLHFELPNAAGLQNGLVVVDPDNHLNEITRRNNMVQF